MAELEKKIDERLYELSEKNRTRWLTSYELKELYCISNDKSLRESEKFGPYLCDRAKYIYDLQMDRLNGKKHW